MTTNGDNMGDLLEKKWLSYSTLEASVRESVFAASNPAQLAAAQTLRRSASDTESVGTSRSILGQCACLPRPVSPRVTILTCEIFGQDSPDSAANGYARRLALFSWLPS